MIRVVAKSTEKIQRVQIGVLSADRIASCFDSVTEAAWGGSQTSVCRRFFALSRPGELDRVLKTKTMLAMRASLLAWATIT
jgi:hypothetical protein